MKINFNRKFLRELSAEFYSTAFLLLVGTSTSIIDKLTNPNGTGPSIIVFLGWATAVLLAVCISLGISGAHLNPAVSFAFALNGDLKWYKFPGYCFAQVFGAFCGSGLAFLVYHEALNNIDGGKRELFGPKGTAALFATYQSDSLSTSYGFVNEMVATALLLICVMALIDEKNLCLPRYLLAPMMGLVIMTLNCSFSYNSGLAMNPARDLGPRFFTLIAGWGPEVFSHRNWNWFWVPIVGPMVGAPIGLFSYRIFVSFDWMGNYHGESDFFVPTLSEKKPALKVSLPKDDLELESSR